MRKMAECKVEAEAWSLLKEVAVPMMTSDHVRTRKLHAVKAMESRWKRKREGIWNIVRFAKIAEKILRKREDDIQV